MASFGQQITCRAISPLIGVSYYLLIRKLIADIILMHVFKIVSVN